MLHSATFRESIGNSLLLGAATATVVTALSAVAGWCVARRVPGSQMEFSIAEVRASVSRGGIVDYVDKPIDTKALVIKPTKAVAYPAEFLETFWAIYPRRVNKLDALKSWKRAVTLAGGGKEAVERIRTACVAFSEASRGKDPQYIPHPATWLNKGAWEEGEHLAPGQHRPGYIPMGVGG